MQSIYYKRRMLFPRLEPKLSERLFTPNYGVVFTKKNDLYTVSYDLIDINEGNDLLERKNPNLRFDLINEAGDKMGFLYEDIKEVDLHDTKIHALLNLFDRKKITERLIKNTLDNLLPKTI